jgi:hypothetical protein
MLFEATLASVDVVSLCVNLLLLIGIGKVMNNTCKLSIVNNSSIVACVSVAAVTNLSSRCLATVGDKHTDTQTFRRDL